MKIKYNTITVIMLFLFTCTLSAQNTLEQQFKEELNNLIRDAVTGFRTATGPYKETNYNHRFYKSNTLLLNSGRAGLEYAPEEYFKYANVTDPQDFWFWQELAAATPEGAYVFDNAELTFDSLAAAAGLKKKIEKRSGKTKKDYKDIVYYARKQKVLELHFNLPNKTVTIMVHSAQKPLDAPNYLGCLILYQLDGQYAVSAIALYVYGEKVDDEQQLYRNAISTMTSGGSRYTSYEWYAGAKRKDVDNKLSALVGTYQQERINTEGYGIE